jgi:glyoxalase family protein
MSTITGLHHVTAISGDAQENLDFYVGVLGMRLVKRSVNQDDPGTYHLFYADAEGHAGTDLTFFPWKNMPRGRLGHGLTNEVALAVPADTLDWWSDRLAAHGVAGVERSVRFGEPTLAFEDPHGLRVALTETQDPREFTAWDDSPVPASHQIRGLHAVRIVEQALEPTVRFLTETLAFVPVGEEDGWHRYRVAPGGGSGRVVDLRQAPQGERRGQWGVGTIHHVAWRVPDDAAEREVQERVFAGGVQPTEVIDRFWFKSVYFKEPGGALFELATDGPGFAIDEHPERLGETLVLPPFLEGHRAQIEKRLPTLTMPAKAGR